jgi:hypothetical protein|tara:strand:- start:61 stop:396 length:336 start_codon:yes stop_codon:yes gene_type:complete
MDAGEKRISQEDCNEDTIGIGILTLTNKRIAFDKKQSRVMDFTATIGDTVLDVPLENITKVWKEGLLMKKVCFTAKTKDGEKTYKFGVFNNGGWRKTLEKTLENFHGRKTE